MLTLSEAQELKEGDLIWHVQGKPAIVVGSELKPGQFILFVKLAPWRDRPYQLRFMTGYGESETKDWSVDPC